MKLLRNGAIRDPYDVIVVGAGIGGLTAAALLAKRGLDVLVIEQHYLPGGCCTSLRRQDMTFDVGAAMLFGFGERGYNPHRFVMSEIEEEIEMVPYESIFRLHIQDREVTFWRDFDRYFGELVAAFPHEEKGLREFYRFLSRVYESVASEQIPPVPPSEMPLVENLKMFFRNPFGTLRLGSLMRKSTESILNRFVSDPDIISFFDALSGAFSGCNVSELPVILGATVFVDTHVGGAAYPAGSPQMLSNKLEKAVEKYGGQILSRQLVREILIHRGSAYGVRLADGTVVRSGRVISNGTLWNLYGTLVRPRHIRPERMEWAQRNVPTASGLILYLGVNAEAVPRDARHIEMYIEDVSEFSSRENFALFIPSLDDPSVCPPPTHVITVMANTDIAFPRPFEPAYQSEEYRRLKEKEADRLLDKLEQRFPDLRHHIRVMEVATPSTIERYTLRNWGTIGGPKQSMGQDMLNRLRARSEWKNLYLCGDSTVMGEGVVATTVSGIGAANMVLRDLGEREYLPRPFSGQYVKIGAGKPWVPAPDPFLPITPESAARVARECQFCEDPGCIRACPAGIDALGFIRRIESGNYLGAVRSMREMNPFAEVCGAICPAERLCEKECNRRDFSNHPVAIKNLQAWVCGQVPAENGWVRRTPSPNGHRVAVVGAGPAGLTCSHFLASLGYQVEVFERTEKVGGMLSLAIPTFRLPEDMVERELRGIIIPGISFRHGRELGKDFTATGLLKEYRAVFLAPGLWRGQKLTLPGMVWVEAQDALSFLKTYREQGSVSVSGRVLVIGGGSVAADAALIAKEAGASKVTLVCLEREEEMPALASEVDELRKHGVEIRSCWGPKTFLSATRVSLVCCTSVYDQQGRFNPTYYEAQTTEMDFDSVIMAVGQSVDPDLAPYLKEEFDQEGLLEVEEDTMQVKNSPGIYAGGEIVRGTGTVVQAVGDGRRAALAIDAYVRRTHPR